MTKKFIDSTRLQSKELVALKVDKLKDKPEQIAFGLSLSVGSDAENKKSFSKDDVIQIRVSLNITMFDNAIVEKISSSKEEPSLPSEDEACFKCTCEIAMNLIFIETVCYDKDVIEQFREGIFSLAYDDIRIIIENSLNRTSYKGFYLPDDFRSILNREYNDY